MWVLSCHDGLKGQTLHKPTKQYSVGYVNFNILVIFILIDYSQQAVTTKGDFKHSNMERQLNYMKRFYDCEAHAASRERQTKLGSLCWDL